MVVIRVEKTSNYTVMSNWHLKEKQMTLKAKGLLSLMLSLPNDWDYSIAGLVTLSNDGKDSVMNALKELESLGYLIRKKQTDAKGRFAGYEYIIFEMPNTEKPQEELPCSEKPNTDNPTQLNTKQSNTKKQSIKKQKESKKSEVAFDTLIENYAKGNEEIKTLLGEWLKVRKAKRAAMTNYAIELNLNKLDRLAKESNLTVPEYLKEVICRGWQAFYAIKNFDNKKNDYASSKDYSDLDGVI